jgi:hypothetical protein
MEIAVFMIGSITRLYLDGKPGPPGLPRGDDLPPLCWTPTFAGVGPDAVRILSEALRLCADDRGELVDQLLRSLDRDADGALEPADQARLREAAP